MLKKIRKIFGSELLTAAFYLVFAFCLLIFPIQTVNLISKWIFALVLIGTGIYYLAFYLIRAEKGTILDMFTGVIVLVLGGFLLRSPQVVVKLLPLFLGACILVDSIAGFRGAFQLKKKGKENWQLYLMAAILCLAFGTVALINPFSGTGTMVLFCGLSFLFNGLKDLLLFIATHKTVNKKKEDHAEAVSVIKDEGEMYQEYDPELAARLAKEDEENDGGDREADVVNEGTSENEEKQEMLREPPVYEEYVSEDRHGIEQKFSGIEVHESEDYISEGQEISEVNSEGEGLEEVGSND